MPVIVAPSGTVVLMGADNAEGAATGCGGGGGWSAPWPPVAAFICWRSLVATASVGLSATTCFNWFAAASLKPSVR